MQLVYNKYNLQKKFVHPDSHRERNSWTKMKILLITNIPNPYRIPLFNEMNSQLKEKGHDLLILFGAKSYARRKFSLNWYECQFRYTILQSRMLKLIKSEGLVFTYPGVMRSILNEKPQKVVVAGFSIATLKVFLLSFFVRFNYYIWSGAVEQKGRFDSKWQQKFRRMLAKRAKGFICYGTKAKQYVMHLGVAESKISISLNTVDTQFFADKTQAMRSTIQKNAVPVLTYIGYLNRRKNVARLIDIASELHKSVSFKMVLVGDGDEKNHLVEKVKNEGLSDAILFEGFRQKSELPNYLAHSDIFLFQTDFDIWGLVLNEAMAAGCCCLASVHAGATFDLIEEGTNGYAVDFSKVESCSTLIKELLNNPERTKQIGANAAKTIQEKASTEISAQQFVHALVV